MEERWGASIGKKWIWWNQCGRSLSCGWRSRLKIFLVQFLLDHYHYHYSITIRPNPSSCYYFSMVSGMDENYDYLKEILLWDPVAETWQVFWQTLYLPQFNINQVMKYEIVKISQIRSATHCSGNEETEKEKVGQTCTRE